MREKALMVFLVVIIFSTGVAMAQTEWTDHPDSPLIGPGEPGEWDDGGHWLSHVVFDGSIYHMWFTGIEADGDWWDLGHATSADGVAWTMDPENPVLIHGEFGEWDDWGITDVAVVYDGTLFHMWYGAFHHDLTAQGGYATSPDGTVWTKYENNPVLTPGPPGSSYANSLGPSSVISDGGTYRMWCPGMDAGGIVRIGYAESSDGIEWAMHPVPVLEIGKLPGAFDSALIGHSNVVFDGSTYHMWYMGRDGQGPRKIGYAYSSDGIQWVKHRGNPVLESPTVGVDLPHVIIEGTTFRMWYSYDDTWISYATSDCCPGVAALDNWQFIPAAAVASGALGAFYQTDVDIGNADDHAVEYEFSWLPRGETNSEPVTSDVFTLGAGMSARYANALSEVFDLEPNSFGALLIKASSPDLLAMSRTYNLGDDGSGGTYGQAMPAVGLEDFIGQGETRRIFFGTENADMRTNVGCQNGSLDTVAVFLELFDAQGTSLARPFVTLGALGNDQVNRIFDGHNPVNGYIEVSSPSPGASYTCYGSVLDNVTSDPTTIPPQ